MESRGTAVSRAASRVVTWRGSTPWVAQCASLTAPYPLRHRSNPSYYKSLPPHRAPHANNSAAQIGSAGDHISANSPRFSGLGQFALYILALRKQPDCTPFQQRNCVADQPVERGECTGGHDVESLRCGADKVLDSLRVDNGGKRELGGRGAQEGGFLLRALDQMNRGVLLFRQRAGDDQSREAAARAEVDPAARGRGNGDELQRIRDVAGPQPRNGRSRDEIGLLLPRQEQIAEAVDALP